jgi:hypothetical protein
MINANFQTSKSRSRWGASGLSSYGGELKPWPLPVWRFDAFVRYRQLEHPGLLALFQKRQENDGPIWEFQRVVMGGWDFLVDLSEDRSPVPDDPLIPKPYAHAPDLVRKGQFRTR